MLVLVVGVAGLYCIVEQHSIPLSRAEMKKDIYLVIVYIGGYLIYLGTCLHIMQYSP